MSLTVGTPNYGALNLVSYQRGDTITPADDDLVIVVDVSDDNSLNVSRADSFGVKDHALLESNLVWGTSGHTGTSSTFAGFDGTGSSTNYTESNYLLTNGTRPLTGNWDVGGFYVQGLRFISDVAIGTAPITCTSTTVCTNLNADKADGFDFDQDVTTTGDPIFDTLGLPSEATSRFSVQDGSVADPGVVRIGADTGLTTMTNQVGKRANITAPHWRSDTEEDNQLMYYQHDSWTFSSLYFGGGNVNTNAVNKILFYTTTGGASKNGDLQMSIEKTGEVRINDYFTGNRNAAAGNDCSVRGDTDNNLTYWDASVDATGMGTATPDSKLHIAQTSTTGAKPVLHLNQADVSEQFIKFTGTAAAATLTNSLVNVSDVTTYTLVGLRKVNVQDEGNQITDGDYFEPFYGVT